MSGMPGALMLWSSADPLLPVPPYSRDLGSVTFSFSQLKMTELKG